MTTQSPSANKRIIDVIEVYRNLPPAERNTGATVVQLVNIAGTDSHDTLSPIPFAIRTAHDFGVSELAAEFIERVQPKVTDPQARLEMLIGFFNNHMVEAARNPELWKKVLGSLKDVINLPMSNGRTPIFNAIQEERNGLKGLVRMMMDFGADPRQIITDLEYDPSGNDRFNAIEYVKSLIISGSPASIPIIQASNQEWQCILGILEGREPEMPGASVGKTAARNEERSR